MKLGRLLETADAPITLVAGSRSVSVESLCVDSRRASAGALFMALPGTRVHGCAFVSEAVKKGAAAVLVPSDRQEELLSRLPEHVALLAAPDVSAVAGRLAHAFFGRPSSRLEVIGITGTNGKTTCSFLLEAILDAWGKKTAVSGTICQKVAGKETKAELTTPDCVSFHSFLKRALDSGADYVVTEVSSHALDQGRVEGCRFKAALFTNLTRDHLDYHNDISSYFEAKARLFRNDMSEIAVVNLDDPYGQRLWDSSGKKKVSYGAGTETADVVPLSVRLDREGIHVSIRYGEDTVSISSRLLGRHNLYNILAASAVSLSLNVPAWAVKRGLEAVTSIPGRLECVWSDEVTALVDYAHTPDAVRSVLQALGEIKGRGRLITILGCGGDRDRGKRPQMASVSAALSDVVVFTSDNPRSEDPSRIIDHMLQGVEARHRHRVRVIEDRKEAIYWSVSQADSGDMLLVAGKGHEDYQIVQGKRLPFDDRKVLKEAMQAVSDSGALAVTGRRVRPILRNVCSASHGTCSERFQFVSFDTVSTDTRSIAGQALFWAIEGERFDGNDFVAEALEKGAAAAVCHEGRFPISDGPVVWVGDTLYALGEFAAWYRRFLGLRTIAITGSCGKTTTKELVLSALRTSFRAGATKGNFNNLVGLPLTIFSMEPGTEWAVLEMGTNMPGEIERLCRIAGPELGLVTCVRPVHLEGLGSMENIAREKGYLFECLPEHGTAVCNLDDSLVVANLGRTRARSLWGYTSRAEREVPAEVENVVAVTEFQDTEDGLRLLLDACGEEVEVRSRLHGEVNVSNIAASFAAAMAIGMDVHDIARGIAECSPPKGRMNVYELGGWTIVDDAYNANPASMKAAMDFLRGLPARHGRNLVIGDMLELGHESRRYHLEMGAEAARLGPRILVAVGEMAGTVAEGAMEAGLGRDRIVAFRTAAEAAEFLASEEGIFFNGTKRVVLVKGSRGVGLEAVSEVIRQRLGELG